MLKAPRLAGPSRTRGLRRALSQGLKIGGSVRKREREPRNSVTSAEDNRTSSLRFDEKEKKKRVDPAN